MIGPLKVTAIPKVSPVIYICKYRRNPIWCHSDLFTVNDAHIIRSFDESEKPPDEVKVAIPKVSIRVVVGSERGI
ncbi:hypothetical protein OCU04_006216 [Sclerotinia nivalis]|uniref:Uncharacterized protein n=1 Tax=Sclerotinia nivalis TaxID=352851 RepID=A0A9X0DJ64_9HELO|nr:hypothetical protein OCU04_006216 [Sclerotinia nivalis]